jgi:hypothetical protein
VKVSLRLLLEDFLGLMREEGELDIYLPLLLSAMGHEIVWRAQKGTRQYGDDDKNKKLFLWCVKCGDIDRHDWDSGKQSVRQSINDVGDVYLMSHIAPQHVKLAKKLVVVTNGDFKPTLVQTISSFLKAWANQHGVEASIVNGSTLAAWTERHLLDENVLPPENKILFRRMLANVSSPELSIGVGRTLIDSLVVAAKLPAKSAPARRKGLLRSLRGIQTALRVLQAWASNEGNLLAPYRLAEFAVLRVWAGLHEEMSRGDSNVSKEFGALLVLLTEIAEAFHEKVQPYYVTQDGFASALPESLLVTDAAFQEVGRLGLQGCIWSFFAIETGDQVAEGRARLFGTRLLTLLKSHKCTESPAYDHHGVAIHIGLLCLLLCNHRDDAVAWLGNVSTRLAHAANSPRHWPLSGPFDEILLVRHGMDEVSQDMMATSSLVPILLIWSAALGMDDLYKFIREKIPPAVPKTTMNFWSADVGFDAVIANAQALQEHGVGEAVLHFPVNAIEFLTNMSAPLPGVQAIEDAVWYRLRCAYVPLLAALHWNLQIPREMLVKQTMAVAGEAGKGTGGGI